MRAAALLLLSLGLAHAAVLPQKDVHQEATKSEEAAKLERVLEEGQDVQQQVPFELEPIQDAPEEAFNQMQEIPENVIQEEDADPEATENEASVLPVNQPLGEISGLAIDKKGRLIAFHRADREWNQYSFLPDEKLNKSLGVISKPTIAVIDRTSGKVLEEHGKDFFFMPHGMTIDDVGNVWVTDVGSHQVHKLDSTMKPVMSLGEKLVPGADEKHFCKPTDVAVAKNGYFFVADGYCNSRVIKFDPKGKVVDVFGAPADEQGANDFVIPHSLALIEDMNLICVADRENERVQCFSAGLAEGHRTIPAGIPITSAEQIGRVFAIREKKHYLIGATGRDSEEEVEPQLFVMDMTNGRAKTFVEGIENVHSLAVSDDGIVYMGQMHPNQIVSISLAEQVDEQ